MNVRIIDPGKPLAVKPRQWGLGRQGEELGELDETDAKAPDDRLELLLDLLSLQYHLLLEGAKLGLVPPSLRAVWLRRDDQLGASMVSLEGAAGDLGVVLPPARRPDLRAGFAGLQGVTVCDPLRGGSDLIGAALFLDALGLAVVSAFLREEDRAAVKNVLVEVLADSARFAGRLQGYLDDHDAEAGDRAGEWLSLVAPVGSIKPVRMWSFDLLRMSIRRLLGGGFFPADQR